MSLIWNPRKSPLRIEYSAELLRQVRLEGELEARGILYGRRGDSCVLLLAARKVGNIRDPRITGLDRLGIFVLRKHGEVFLTEKDLGYFERNEAGLALVVAGDRGGFFVREANGTMLCIQSRQEFAVPELQKQAKSRVHRRNLLNASGLAMMLIALVGVALYAGPKASLAFSVHQEAGQVVVRWNPGVNATLEIRNNDRNVQVPVSIAETQTTYKPESGQLEIRFTTQEGQVREERLAITNSGPLAPSILTDIAKLEEERDGLMQESSTNRTRITELEQKIPRLSALR